jgi:hypothetical protein
MKFTLYILVGIPLLIIFYLGIIRLIKEFFSNK